MDTHPSGHGSCGFAGDVKKAREPGASFPLPFGLSGVVLTFFGLELRPLAFRVSALKATGEEELDLESGDAGRQRRRKVRCGGREERRKPCVLKDVSASNNCAHEIYTRLRLYDVGILEGK